MTSKLHARAFITRLRGSARNTVFGACQLGQNYKVELGTLFIVQLVAYSYLFTTLFISNHTFPNVWRHTYPSFKTLGEGRWMADLLIAAQGGSGVPSFQMACAALIQALNSILIAKLLNIKSRSKVILIGSTLCLYPLFLDYFSFSIDHISFALGDTLCLLGALVWTKRKRPIIRILGSSALFVAAIGIYGPKVALVSLLLLISLLIRVFNKPNETDHDLQQGSHRTEISTIAKESAISVATILLTMALSVAIAKFTITFDIGVRTHINSPFEAAQEILASYKNIYIYYQDIGGLPRRSVSLVAFIMLVGTASFLSKAITMRKHYLAFLLLIIVLIPIALQSPWIINNAAWRNAGRIQSANAYLLVIFLGFIINSKNLLRFAGFTISSVLIYFFFVHATQQTNFILMKTVYETNFMNRLASRVEPLINNSKAQPQSLIVIGEIPPLKIAPYVRYPSKDVHVTQTQTFAPYRQVEFLNFFLGRESLRVPTKSEVTNAIELARPKSATWPSSKAVKALGNSIIVILELPSDDIPSTRTGSL